jgi:hypothetical protein
MNPQHAPRLPANLKRRQGSRDYPDDNIQGIPLSRFPEINQVFFV